MDRLDYDEYQLVLFNVHQLLSDLTEIQASVSTDDKLATHITNARHELRSVTRELGKHVAPELFNED